MDQFDNEWWKSTLMGGAFWREINERNRLQLEAISHTQIPVFNADPPRDPLTPRKDEAQKPRTRRRFSMSDALSLALKSSESKDTDNKSTLDFGKTETRTGNRFLNFAKRALSRTPSQIFSRRGEHPLFRSPFKMSPPPTPKKDDKFAVIPATAIKQEVGTLLKPLMYFRGGASWKCLPRNAEIVSMDVFWPIQENQDEGKEDMLPLEELKPIIEFRSLRVLKITGMMQSYQKYIWEVVWLNPELTDLWLEMALEPSLESNLSGEWQVIKHNWKVQEPFADGFEIYYGDKGTGNLNPSIGDGEYLDKNAMEKAKMRAMIAASMGMYLPIRNMTLVGFVVDAGPFHLFFDPEKLKRITFKRDCVDAGFFLPEIMKNRVCVVSPRPECKAVAVPIPRQQPQSHNKNLSTGDKDSAVATLAAARAAGTLSSLPVDVLKDLKVIDLKGGKKIGEEPFDMKKHGHLLAERNKAGCGKRGCTCHLKENQAGQKKPAGK
ncbi:hypothetical protein ASPZODRAFT_163543 [Penicilliopsis zonata CBS 506.65]|uniref:Uncharacterized protein n=1 Tax=Penicilliopsis zonata CBS 506.65 TaxID=1073090 RepID=A0A1L9SX33_9EURO|nr:hypothetical protein ASPZODRAFT_163543 [Penicilliopsis zonata CBS 506.65]OJJ51755.1 hypothetical protein ASPZODRAFT_163543 [Penicilliopsis zonata CBS 506.65]